MTEKQSCAVCFKDGTTSYSRCGHILHEDCRSSVNRCRRCGYRLSPADVENIYCNFKFSDLKSSEKENLEECIYSFAHTEYDYDIGRLDHESLSQLESFGWDINRRGRGVEVKFLQACKNDDIDRVNLFIEHGFDYKKYGENGLEEACSNLSYVVIEKLLSLGFKLSPDFIFKLIRNKKLEALKLAIDSGFDVNYSKLSGERPIHVAAETGSIEIIKFLIDKGADCQGFNENEYTLVHLAARNNNNLRLIKYLEESGFDLNARSKENRETPLMLAVKNKKSCVTRYLIDTVGNLEDVDKHGRTALHHSTFLDGKVESMKILLLNGANPNAKDCNGMTPLHLARSDYDGKVEMLLDFGADMHVRDNEGKVPYDYICNRLYEDIKQRFIAAGFQITQNK